MALSRVEHFSLKQVIDLDDNKASQRTKSLASSLRVRDLFSSSFLTHTAPCKVQDTEQTLNKCCRENE